MSHTEPSPCDWPEYDLCPQCPADGPTLYDEALRPIIEEGKRRLEKMRTEEPPMNAEQTQAISQSAERVLLAANNPQVAEWELNGVRYGVCTVRDDSIKLAQHALTRPDPAKVAAWLLDFLIVTPMVDRKSYLEERTKDLIAKLNAGDFNS